MSGRSAILLFVFAIVAGNLLAMARNSKGNGRRRDRIVSDAPAWERISYALFWAGMAYLTLMALTGKI